MQSFHQCLIHTFLQLITLRYNGACKWVIDPKHLVSLTIRTMDEERFHLHAIFFEIRVDTILN